MIKPLSIVCTGDVLDVLPGTRFPHFHDLPFVGSRIITCCDATLEGNLNTIWSVKLDQCGVMSR